MSSILSIANVYNSEPMRKNRWVLEFDEIPIHPFDRDIENGLQNSGASKGLLRQGKEYDISNRAGDIGKEKSLAVSLFSASRPTFGNEEMTLVRGNQQYYFPTGRTTFEPLAVVFYDNIKFRAGKILYDWASSVRNNIDFSVGYKRNFSTNAQLKLLDPKGAVVEQWTYIGLWPKQVNFGELDYSATDALQVTATFRYDSIRMSMYDQWEEYSAIPTERRLASDPYGIPDGEFGDIVNDGGIGGVFGATNQRQR